MSAPSTQEEFKEDLAQLFERAKQNNTEAFGKIYTLCFSPIYRYIYLRVKNKQETEDLVQTVFLKAHRHLANFRHIAASPLAYLFTIARNAVIDFYRKKRTLVENSEQVLVNIPDTRTDLPEQLQKNEEIKRVLAALQALTDDQQEVITLKFIEQLENEEICKITGRSHESIRQIQSRGLKKLRDLLKEN